MKHFISVKTHIEQYFTPNQVEDFIKGLSIGLMVKLGVPPQKITNTNTNTNAEIQLLKIQIRYRDINTENTSSVLRKKLNDINQVNYDKKAIE